jgi:hypothetical protein
MRVQKQSDALGLGEGERDLMGWVKQYLYLMD